MVLALIGIVLVLFAIPTALQTKQHRDAGVMRGYLMTTLKNQALVRMNIGVFILHLVMTANFLVLPPIFEHDLALPRIDHWHIYLPIFAGSFLLSIPLIIVAETKHKIRSLLIASTIAILLAELAMEFSYTHISGLLAAFFLFFVCFNFLEAIQLSLVAKYSNVSTKGTAMGIFSSSQFLGIFAGGSLGGIVNHHWGTSGVFLFCALVVATWLVIALRLPAPSFYTSRLLKLRDELLINPQQLEHELLSVAGVKEVALAPDEQVAYLKVDKNALDKETLKPFAASEETANLPA